MRAFVQLYGAYLGFWIVVALIVLAHAWALLFVALGMLKRILGAFVVAPIVAAILESRR